MERGTIPVTQTEGLRGRELGKFERRKERNYQRARDWDANDRENDYENKVFKVLYGSGLDDEPYNATRPMRVYSSPPFWAVHKNARRMTVLLFLERRAFQSLKPRTGSYRERRKAVKLKLAERWEKKWDRNEARRSRHGSKKDYLDYENTKLWLEKTKNIPRWLEKVLEDYYPSDEYTPFAWDCGQTAFRSGVGLGNKILIRQILKKVNTIGKQFPRRFPRD